MNKKNLAIAFAALLALPLNASAQISPSSSATANTQASITPSSNNASSSNTNLSANNATVVSQPCTTTSAPWIQVLSPNGGQTYVPSQPIIVTWASCNISSSSSVALALKSSANTSLSYSFANVQGDFLFANDGQENVLMPTSGSLANWTLGSTFTVRATATIGLNQYVSDSSDAPFTVTTGSYTGGTGYSGSGSYAGGTGYSGSGAYSGGSGYSGTGDYSGSGGYTGGGSYAGSGAYQGTSAVGASLCTPYMKKYVKYGASNDPEEVKKLEQFLNDKQGEHVAVDGIYALEDVEAVKRFQQKYKSEVLDIWGLSEPTGYVYRTTLLKINSFYCSNVTCPAFSEYNSMTVNASSTEVAKTKALLSDLGFYSGTINNTFDASLSASIKNFQETFKETMLTPWGLTEGTGYKYKTTNKFLNMVVGCKTPPVELEGVGTFDY